MRISGNDGRMRGRIKACKSGEVFREKEIVQRSIVELVQSTDGYILKNDETVAMGEVVKTVLIEGKQVLLVIPANEESIAPCVTSRKNLFLDSPFLVTDKQV
ncbi:putative dna-binding protein containing a zn-ribbon domain [hydrocarbon metagenome]|uniref:Putative dna-binding protein containing a zn-ribbon domain n=1 Tax=hydrocarbon metagenome TaxID=938273 RepID=A0A0W8E9Q1_9ZZZZ